MRSQKELDRGKNSVLIQNDTSISSTVARVPLDAHKGKVKVEVLLEGAVQEKEGVQMKKEAIQMKKQWMQILMFLLLMVCIIGCATTLSDIVKSKEEGKGTSRIYPVNADKAWEIAKTILNWEGIGAIEEHRSEGYMLKISGKTLISYGTLIGVWIEPMDKVQSKVTIITKPRMSTDSFITLSETDFHNNFDLFVQKGKLE